MHRNLPYTISLHSFQRVFCIYYLFLLYKTLLPCNLKHVRLPLLPNEAADGSARLVADLVSAVRADSGNHLGEFGTLREVKFI